MPQSNEPSSEQINNKANPTKDPYSVLGVPKNASIEVINHAFKQLMRRNHPDKFPNASPEQIAEQHRITIELVEAHDILTKEGSQDDIDEVTLGPDPHFFDKYASKQEKEVPRYEGDPSCNKFPMYTYENAEALCAEILSKLSNSNSGTPVDPHFKLNSFTEGFLAQWNKDPNDLNNTVALIGRLKNNLNNLQGSMGKKDYPFNVLFPFIASHPLLACFITCFDSDWLKGLRDFNSESIGFFLQKLPIVYWKRFIKHIGEEWFKEEINSPQAFYYLFQGYAIGGNNSSKQVIDLLNLIGRDHFRTLFEPYQLGWYLNRFSYNGDILPFLQGEDNWISQSINTGSALNEVLKGIKVSTRDETSMIENWRLFLQYLDKDWNKRILNEKGEIKKFFLNFDQPEDQKTLMSLLFSKEFTQLHRDEFLHSLELVDLLSPKLIDSWFNQNKQLQNLFTVLKSQKEIPDIELVIQEFIDREDMVGKEDLVDTEQKIPIYLLAITKVYGDQLLGNSLSIKPGFFNVGPSRSQALHAVDCLRVAILHDKQVPDTPGTNQGLLGAVTAVLSKYTNPSSSNTLT